MEKTQLEINHDKMEYMKYHYGNKYYEYFGYLMLEKQMEIQQAIDYCWNKFGPKERPVKPPQWWIDNNTDGFGNCFSDADPGL